MNKYRKLLKELKKYDTFLITSHINPEGDSIGSQLAFAYLLRALGKKSYIFDAHKPNHRYAFLPHVKSVHTTLNPLIKYDAICFLDCADIKRVGDVKEKIDLSKPKINIDHHLSSTRFGDFNLIQANTSSTAEILYSLFKEAGVKINKDTAICLYAAILTDTGSFGYSNVTSFTHKVTSELLKTHLDVTKVHKNIYENTSPAAMRLLGEALATLELSRDNKIAWMEINKNMLKKSRARLADEEDFINFPRSVTGVKVAVLFTDMGKNRIKVGLRSNSVIDVNEIASYFKGGGHKKASGCLIEGPMREVKEKVLRLVRKYV